MGCCYCSKSVLKRDYNPEEPVTTKMSGGCAISLFDLEPLLVPASNIAGQVAFTENQVQTKCSSA